MPYNLIEEAWIPIRRADGTQDYVAPWQITAEYQNKARRIVAVQSPRPDFDAALVQFLIGLAQTCIAPRDNAAWRDLFNNPPPPDTLHQAFAPVAHAFNLDGDGPRFMQEKEVTKRWPITALLINAPGDKTLEKNTDFFIKRSAKHEKDAFCRSCAASALLTMQLFAPGGGRGKNGSLRGIGVLSMLIIGETLWETIASNLVVDRALTSITERHNDRCKIFPWLEPGKFVKEHLNRPTNSSDFLPLHVFWSCPRRYWLSFQSPVSKSECSLCGRRDDLYADTVFDKPAGISYCLGSEETGGQSTPTWVSPLHPFSAYETGGEAAPRAIQTPDTILYFRHWMGLVVSRKTSDKAGLNTVAPSVLTNYRHVAGLNPKPTRIWAHGFQIQKTNNIKAWVDSLASIPSVEQQNEPILADFIHALVASSDLVLDAALECLKWILLYKPQSERNSKKIKWIVRDRQKAKIVLASQIARTFSLSYCAALEEDFYSSLPRYNSSDSEKAGIKKKWFDQCVRNAKSLIEKTVESSALDVNEPKAVACALKEAFSFWLWKKCCQILSLPITTKEVE